MANKNETWRRPWTMEEEDTADKHRTWRRPWTMMGYSSGGSSEGGGGGGTGGGSSSEEWIGDGNTHIWVRLAYGRTSPMLGVCPNGTVTVDWGDGTTPDVLTGTRTMDLMWTPTHNYAKPGDYVISLTVDGEMKFYGNANSYTYACILRHSSSANMQNYAYQNAIYKIEIGRGISSIGSHAFRFCRALQSVDIPEGIVDIGSYAFDECNALSSIAIPDSIANIERNAFAACSGIRYCDFSKHTAVPTLSNTSAFINTPNDCEIRVPAALYDEWIAATNWATYASRIVAV